MPNKIKLWLLLGLSCALLTSGNSYAGWHHEEPTGLPKDKGPNPEEDAAREKKMSQTLAACKKDLEAKTQFPASVRAEISPAFERSTKESLSGYIQSRYGQTLLALKKASPPIRLYVLKRGEKVGNSTYCTGHSNGAFVMEGSEQYIVVCDRGRSVAESSDTFHHEALHALQLNFHKGFSVKDIDSLLTTVDATGKTLSMDRAREYTMTNQEYIGELASRNSAANSAWLQTSDRLANDPEIKRLIDPEGLGTMGALTQMSTAGLFSIVSESPPRLSWKPDLVAAGGTETLYEKKLSEKLSKCAMAQNPLCGGFATWLKENGSCRRGAAPATSCLKSYTNTLLDQLHSRMDQLPKADQATILNQFKTEFVNNACFFPSSYCTENQANIAEKTLTSNRALLVKQLGLSEQCQMVALDSRLVTIPNGQKFFNDRMREITQAWDRNGWEGLQNMRAQQQNKNISEGGYGLSHSSISNFDRMSPAICSRTFTNEQCRAREYLSGSSGASQNSQTPSTSSPGATTR